MKKLSRKQEEEEGKENRKGKYIKRTSWWIREKSKRSI
jgi:hypothetical protein